MASTQSIARKLGWLLACLTISGMACDDDSAADADGEHAAEHEANGGHSNTAGASGTESDHEHDTTKMIGPLTGATCPANSTLTYENFGKKFFQDYCLGCHSSSVQGAQRHDAPADHNFDTLEDIQLLAPHIDQYAGSGPDRTNTMMPPANSPAPTKEERAKLSEWLACNAKAQ